MFAFVAANRKVDNGLYTTCRFVLLEYALCFVKWHVLRPVLVWSGCFNLQLFCLCADDFQSRMRARKYNALLAVGCKHLGRYTDISLEQQRIFVDIRYFPSAGVPGDVRDVCIDIANRLIFFDKVAICAAWQHVVISIWLI